MQHSMPVLINLAHFHLMCQVKSLPFVEVPIYYLTGVANYSMSLIQFSIFTNIFTRL